MQAFNPFLKRIFSTAIFYIGWVVCLEEATVKHAYYGFLIVLSFIAYFLICSKSRKADSSLLGCVLMIGPLSDMFYAYFGLLYYHSVYQLNSFIPPMWVFVLWGLFAANIHLFSWLKNRWFLSVLFGAVGGAMSYLSVVKLGGATLLKPMPLVLVFIGTVWGISFPLFIWLEDYLKRKLGVIST